MVSQLVANFVAKKVVRWGIIAGLNAIGIASVAGIPIVAIIDAILIYNAIRSGIQTGVFFAQKGAVVGVSIVSRTWLITKFILKSIFWVGIIIFLLSSLFLLTSSLFKDEHPSDKTIIEKSIERENQIVSNAIKQVEINPAATEYENRRKTENKSSKNAKSNENLLLGAMVFGFVTMLIQYIKVLHKRQNEGKLKNFESYVGFFALLFMGIALQETNRTVLLCAFLLAITVASFYFRYTWPGVLITVVPSGLYYLEILGGIVIIPNLF